MHQKAIEMDQKAAMATIHSQPHLSSLLHSQRDPEDNNDDDNNGSSSSGEQVLRGDGSGGGGGGLRSSSSSSSPSLRRRCSGDVGARSGNNLPRLGGMIDEKAAQAYYYISAMPGYVSFEDVIGPNAVYRDGSGRPLEAAISDPLMSTVSRLQARGDRSSGRSRKESPGPLGTRRGSTMHWFVKKYVQGFLRGIIICCCFIPPADQT